jgi:hypothetical protein
MRALKEKVSENIAAYTFLSPAIAGCRMEWLLFPVWQNYFQTCNQFRKEYKNGKNH